MESVTRSWSYFVGWRGPLGPEQASQVLQIGRSHLYKLLGRGEIKSIKIGRNRRIPVMELERYIEQEMEDGEEM
jgi:excisionase family DNA binding protein